MIINLQNRKIKKIENETEFRFIDIEFAIKNSLIYNVKNEIERLCISIFCEKKVFRLTHDFNNHVSYHRTYQNLINTVFMSKLTRKIREYVKHCLACELNQTKKHVTYDELIFIIASTIFFCTIAMDFIVRLSKNSDSILTIICKTFKKMTLISDKNT